VSRTVTAPTASVQLTISLSHTSTSNWVCPGAAVNVRPVAVTVHGFAAAVTVNRSRTGASGTFGAGVVVIVWCHVASMVTDTHEEPR
jgi:hypothetical protein